MLLIAALVFFLFFFPFTAWAYFDPGFGGYLINTILSLIAAGFAFVSAAVIYFFRTMIGKKLHWLWQKYKTPCLILLLSVFCIASFLLGVSFHRTFLKPSTPHHELGAHILDYQRMFKGYNLYDGNLMDANGRIVKQWTNYFLGAIDKNGDNYGAQFYEGQWGRYTWDDQVVWKKELSLHHELYLSPKDTVFTFTRETHDYNNYLIDFDVILEYDKNGKELQRFSLWDHLDEFKPYHAKYRVDVACPAILQPFLSIWQKTFHKEHYDYFHLNSFYMVPPNPLEGKDPAFRPGNWIISLMHGNMVFILDQDTKKVLWHIVSSDIDGGLQGQHSVSMLPDGDILLFENGDDRKASRILIIDPLTLTIKWQYQHADFFSKSEGFVQALPNGNFLVTDSKKEHVFEVTPDKEIVWEYYGPILKDHELYRMSRYPQDMIDHFLQKGR